MSRISNINKHRAFRHAERDAAIDSGIEQRRRHPKPVAKSDKHVTPKSLAARRKLGW